MDTQAQAMGDSSGHTYGQDGLEPVPQLPLHPVTPNAMGVDADVALTIRSRLLDCQQLLRAARAWAVEQRQRAEAAERDRILTVEQLTETKRQLAEARNDRDRCAEAAAEERARLHSSLGRAEEVCSDLQNQLAARDAQVKERDELLKGKEGALAHTQRQLSAALAKLDAAEKQVASGLRQLASAGEKLADAARQQQDHEQRLNNQRTSIEQLRADLNAMRTDRNTWRDRAAAYEEECGRLRACGAATKDEKRRVHNTRRARNVVLRILHGLLDTSMALPTRGEVQAAVLLLADVQPLEEPKPTPEDRYWVLACNHSAGPLYLACREHVRNDGPLHDGTKADKAGLCWVRNRAQAIRFQRIHDAMGVRGVLAYLGLLAGHETSAEVVRSITPEAVTVGPDVADDLQAKLRTEQWREAAKGLARMADAHKARMGGTLPGPGPATPAQPEQVAWLVVRDTSDGPAYLLRAQSRFGPMWSPDKAQAMRFVAKADAMAAALLLSTLDGLRAECHPLVLDGKDVDDDLQEAARRAHIADDANSRTLGGGTRVRTMPVHLPVDSGGADCLLDKAANHEPVWCACPKCKPLAKTDDRALVLQMKRVPTAPPVQRVTTQEVRDKVLALLYDLQRHYERGSSKCLPTLDRVNEVVRLMVEADPDALVRDCNAPGKAWLASIRDQQAKLDTKLAERLHARVQNYGSAPGSLLVSSDGTDTRGVPLPMLEPSVPRMPANELRRTTEPLWLLAAPVYGTATPNLFMAVAPNGDPVLRRLGDEPRPMAYRLRADAEQVLDSLRERAPALKLELFRVMHVEATVVPARWYVCSACRCRWYTKANGQLAQNNLLQRSCDLCSQPNPSTLVEETQ